MSRSVIVPESRVQRARRRLEGVPWAVLLQAAVVVGQRWRALSAKDRARLAALVRQTQGRPDRLGPKEREELGRLAGKLDVKRMFAEMTALTRARSHGRKRRRGA
jgi:hypothetical protein